MPLNETPHENFVPTALRLILSSPHILPIKSNNIETWAERKYLTVLV